MLHRDQIDSFIERGGLFVINHSGGKDSQAMMIEMEKIVPRDQLLVIHSNLGRVEWEGSVEHILDTIDGLPLIVCRNTNKTFLQMVEHRGMFPSPSNRQCTSDLKRGPIEREIRRFLAAPENARYGGLVINCIGLRAEESPGRAKQVPLRLNAGNSKNGREWHDLLPIHDMTIDEVWKSIADAGQKPHEVYSKGMRRYSCRFCIMSCDEDLETAARLSPQLYSEYVYFEKKLGYTMMMPRGGVPRTLEEITGIEALPFDPASNPEQYEDTRPSVRYN